MVHDCCRAMKVFSMTKEERDDMLSSLGEEPSDEPHTQTVAWSESLGSFTMADVAIRFCPWCAVSLPVAFRDAEERARKAGVFIDGPLGVGPSDPAETAAFVAELLGSDSGDFDSLVDELRAAAKGQ